MKSISVINIGLTLTEIDKLIKDLQRLRINTPKSVQSVGTYGSFLGHEYPTAIVEDSSNKVTFYRIG